MLQLCLKKRRVCMLASVPCLETPSGCSLEALFAACLPVFVAVTYQNTAGEFTSGLPALKGEMPANNRALPAKGVTLPAISGALPATGVLCHQTATKHKLEEWKCLPRVYTHYATPNHLKTSRERPSRIHDHQSRILMHDGQRSNLCTSI